MSTSYHFTPTNRLSREEQISLSEVMRSARYTVTGVAREEGWLFELSRTRPSPFLKETLETGEPYQVLRGSGLYLLQNNKPEEFGARRELGSRTTTLDAIVKEYTTARNQLFESIMPWLFKSILEKPLGNLEAGEVLHHITPHLLRALDRYNPLALPQEERATIISFLKPRLEGMIRNAIKMLRGKPPTYHFEEVEWRPPVDERSSDALARTDARMIVRPLLAQLSSENLAMIQAWMRGDSYELIGRSRGVSGEAIRKRMERILEEMRRRVRGVEQQSRAPPAPRAVPGVMYLSLVDLAAHRRTEALKKRGGSSQP